MRVNPDAGALSASSLAPTRAPARAVDWGRLRPRHREARVTGTRLLEVSVAFYLLHILEEALGPMHDDPIIVAAYEGLAPLGARHAAYLVFQITFSLGLVGMLLVSHRGLGRRALFAVLGAALVAELHHPVRALLAWASNPGLITSLPLPLFGALLLYRALLGSPGREKTSPSRR